MLEAYRGPHRPRYPNGDSATGTSDVLQITARFNLLPPLRYAAPMPPQTHHSPSPATRTLRTLGGLGEQAALAAALAVPLVFSIFTERVFEAEKAGLIRVLGVVVLAGAVASWLDRSRGEQRPVRDSGATSRDPFIVIGRQHMLAYALLAVWLTEALATAFSVSPITSLMGSYDRAQGLVTTTALVALAFGASAIASRPGGLTRLADAIGLAVLPAGLYGLVQRAGLDPIPWLGDVVTRVSGPSGSSPLFAAHLALALPFTMFGVILAWKAAAEQGAGSASGPAIGWLIGARSADLSLAIRLLSLVIGLTAIVLSGSRGPTIGLAAGAAVAMLAWTTREGRSRGAVAIPLTVLAGIVLVIALNRSPAAFGPIVDLPLIDRLSTALDPEKSTTRVRLRLWEGTVEALASNPGRLILGHGPETMDLVWAPYYPSILAYDEPRGWVPDRAHNLALDTLLTTGVLGLAALLALLGAAVLMCLKVLGLIERATIPSAWMLGCALLCGAAAGLVDGGWRLVGPASGLGLFVGLLLWLASAAWLRSRRSRPDAGFTIGLSIDQVFALAALAALTSHIVELQVSFTVSATRTIVFLLCGAMLGIAHRNSRSARFGPVAEDSTDTNFTDPRSDARWLFPAIVAITLIYALARPGLAGGSASIAAALVVLSGLGVIAVSADGSGAAWRSLRRVSVLAGLYFAIHIILVTTLSESLEQAVSGAISSLALYVAALLGLLAAASGVWARIRTDLIGSLRSSTTSSMPTTDSAVLAAVLLVAFSLAFPLWILPSTSDALLKEGRLSWEAQVPDLRARGDTGRAESLLSRARERYARAELLTPYAPRYALAQAFAAEVHGDIVSERLDRTVARAGLSEDIERPGGDGEYDEGLLDGEANRWAAERDEAFATAIEHIERADRIIPSSPIPQISLARAHRIWGERTRKPPLGAERLASAAAEYAIAIETAPRWPEVREEAARTALLRGRPEEAIALCTSALEGDEFYSRCHSTLAHAHAATGDFAASAEAWAEYFDDSRNAGDADAHRERLRTLLALDRTVAALDTARDVLRLAPDDARTHADMAVLLERSGDLEGARESAANAALLAPEDPGITELVERLAPAP